MKKVFSMILVAAMLLSCITAVPAYAAEGVTYTLNAQVNGDKVEVVITLTGNDEGLTATVFELSYNKEAVAPDMDTYEALGMEADDEFAWYRKTSSSDVDILDNGNVWVMHYNKNGQDVVKDGVVLKMTFDILDSAAPFDFSYDVFGAWANNCINVNGAVPYTFEIASDSHLKGDDGNLGGDGIVYTLDAQVKGDKVDVVVFLSGNDEGISASAFELSYNKAAIAPDMDSYEELGMEADDEFVWYRKTTNTDVDILENGNIFVLHYDKNGQDVVKNGVVFKITFDILDGAQTFDFNYEVQNGHAGNNSNSIGKVPYKFKISGYSDLKGDDAIVAEGSVFYTLNAVLVGERVDATITLSGNVNGLSSTAFMLSYNKDALEVDIESYENLGFKKDDDFVWYYKTASTDITEMDEGIFVLHYNRNAENVVKDGVILKISFNVIDKNELFDFNYAVVDGLAKNNSRVDENGDSVAVPYEFIIAEGTLNIYSHTHTPSAETPTCTENVYCVECEEILEEAVGHAEVVDSAVAPTCTENGLTEGSHCSACGEVFVAQNIVEALGHTVVIDEKKVPTCTEAGLTEGSHCSVCGEVLVSQEVITSPGHTVVVDAAVEATCTTDGLTEGSHCSVCGEILVAQEVVPAFGHTEVIDAAVAPSCYQDGITEGKHCSVCGEILAAQEVVPATGAHVWAEEFTVDTEAAVGVAGERSKHCTTEGCTARGEITAIPALRVVTVNGVESIVSSDEKVEVKAKFFENGRAFDYWEVVVGNDVLVLDREELNNVIAAGIENVIINAVTYVVGDSDNDGSVTASDITTVIKTMKDKGFSKYQDADNDGSCTASDITAVIQIMKNSYGYPGYVNEVE